MSFLAAAALSKVKDLPVQIDLIGTPDEELRGGKAVMVKEGVFKDYDLALMIHISSDRTEPNSEVLALSCYRVVFHGQTAHGAHDPWKGRNALNGAMLALHAVDMLRQHVRPENAVSARTLWTAGRLQTLSRTERSWNALYAIRHALI